MSFKLKTILGIAAIEILLLSILVYSSMQFLKSSNETQLMERAHISAQLFATMTADAVVAMDLATLDELVAKTLTNPGVRYIRVRHASGTILAEGGDEADLLRPFKSDLTIAEAADDLSFDVHHNIAISGETFGRIELGLDIGALEDLVATAWQRMLSVSLIEVILVGIFGWMLGGVLTRQLVLLRHGARTVAAGDFGHQIDVQGRDELADTARSFNDMSRALALYAIDLEEARQQAEDRRAKAESILQEAVDRVAQGILILDENGQVAQANAAFLALHGKHPSDLDTPFDRSILYPDLVPDTQAEQIVTLPSGTSLIHFRCPLSSGGEVWVDTDITDILANEEHTRRLERDLLQSQKMESIGTLAAGIAHEINTPLQAITGNLTYAQDSSQDLLNAVAVAEKLMPQIDDLPAANELARALDKADLDFLRDELPDALSQSLDSLGKIGEIVSAMKEFARPSTRDSALVNINQIIERCLVVSRNEWGDKAEVKLCLEDAIPQFMAVESDLNQVIMHLLVNAADAIAAKGESIGKIYVSTHQQDDHLEVEILDTGTGIEQHVIDRMFDPFFTTKEVGKGTGQGLAICHDTVVNKHGGRIEVDSRLGEGSKFTLYLPSMQSSMPRIAE